MAVKRAQAKGKRKKAKTKAKPKKMTKAQMKKVVAGATKDRGMGWILKL